jgi:2'-5' RNA ligase
MRLFVAVWPPASAADAVAALDRPLVDGLRWTTPDQWHVTLRFLGDVDEPAPVVAELRARVRSDAPSPVSAPTVRMGPVTGRFGHRVLHVPVSGLDRVAAAVADPTDDQPFRGHVTLARARDRRGVDLRPFAGLACGPVEWIADEVTLVQSHLGRGGARYEIIERVTLHA